MDNKILWLWLYLHFGAGVSTYSKLYSHFGSIQKIYDCEDDDIELIDFLSSSQKSKILDKNLNHAEEVSEWCEENNVSVTYFDDENYPSPLKILEDFPAVLFYKGVLPNFNDELVISVVGTRNMTMYGQKCAYEFGYGLSKGGAITVSGMAKGIDCTSQKGTLYAGGKTVAVLGSGIDVVYPYQNLKLYNKIIDNGAVVSEYPPHTPPIASNFPIRNRIISGLSCGVLVVEADLNSGSLITAKLAKEQGKILFAVPGPIKTFTSSGTNELIRDGAFLATSPVDVLEQFLDCFSDKINLTASKEKPGVVFKYKEEPVRTDLKKENNLQNSTGKEETKEFDTSSLTEEELKVYSFFEKEKPLTPDEIDIENMMISDIKSCLVSLEIEGAVKSIPGGRYIRK